MSAEKSQRCSWRNRDKAGKVPSLHLSPGKHMLPKQATFCTLGVPGRVPQFPGSWSRVLEQNPRTFRFPQGIQILGLLKYGTGSERLLFSFNHWLFQHLSPFPGRRHPRLHFQPWWKGGLKVGRWLAILPLMNFALAPDQAEWSANNWGFLIDNRKGTRICQDKSRWAFSELVIQALTRKLS